MASIPLAALHVNTEGPSPLAQYAQAQQIQAGQQEQQARALEIQQRQIALQDQQAQTSALKEWDGKSVDDLPGLLLKHGGSATAVFGMKNQILDQKTKATKLTTDQLDNVTKTNDLVAGHLESVKGAAAEDKQSAYQAAVADLAQKGLIQPGQLPQQYPGDDKIGLFEKQFMGQKQIFEQEQKARETAAKESEAATAKTKAETEAAEFAAKKPGGLLESPESRELNDFLKKNPDKGASDYVAWKAKQSPMAAIVAGNLLGPGGNPSTPLDQAAEKYWSSGEIAPGMGRSPGTTAAIMKRASELHPEGGLAANSAEFKANTGSLKKLQTNYDQVQAFENTAIKNLDQVVKVGATIPDLGAKFANIPIRKITADMIGTENMARFRTALATAQAESAKVLTSANATGVLSDNARDEAKEFLDGNLPYGAMKAQVEQLKTDFGNRHQSYQQQIADIQSRLGGKPTAPPAEKSNDFFGKFGGQKRP